MLHLALTASGTTDLDLLLALEEAVASVRSGNTSGFEPNDSGRFYFDITGAEDPAAEALADEPAARPEP